MTAIVCDVCPRACKLEEGKSGYCGVRANVNGENKNRFHGRLYAGIPEDLPSGVTAWLPGCNLKCWFCNAPFVSKRPDDITDLVSISESQLVENVTAEGDRSLDFFGGEPTLHYEYVLEVSRLCKEKGVLTFLNTNGFINTQIAERLADAVDYPVVGIKAGLSPSLYGKLGANPQVVLDTLKIFYDRNPKTWITYMDGPGLGATHEDHERFATWVHDNIGPNLEVHVGRLLKPAPTYQAVYEVVGDPLTAAIRVSRVALELAECGLRNVWIPSGDWEFRDVISGRTKSGVM